MDTSFRT